MKRKTKHLKLLNRFLKENNCYQQFWHELFETMESKNSSLIDSYLAKVQIRNLLDNGNITLFKRAFNYQLMANYLKWEELNNSWYSLTLKYYNEFYKKNA